MCHCFMDKDNLIFFGGETEVITEGLTNEKSGLTIFHQDNIQLNL